MDHLYNGRLPRIHGPSYPRRRRSGPQPTHSPVHQRRPGRYHRSPYPNPLVPVQGAADLVRTLLHILTTIGTRDFWIRAGKMVVGTAAIIAGLNLVSHDLWGAAGDTVATVAKIATR